MTHRAAKLLMLALALWGVWAPGEPRFLERGDLLFNGTNGYESLTFRDPETVTPSLYIVKEFNELTRWAADGLDWRAEGVAIYGE